MPEHILCIATEEKGYEFLRACAELGVRPHLLTLDKLRDAPWPKDVLEDLSTMPPGLNSEQILNTVSWMARTRTYDRVVALGGCDLETAAQIREHLRIPGMGTTTAGCYTDKLAMRVIARAFGYPVPEFCRVLNYDELREYMRRVRPPWILRPRGEGSAQGIRRIDDPEQLWRVLDELGDLQSHHILDEFIAGDLYHADSLVSERQVKFAAVHQYGRPLANALQAGGIFSTRTVDRSTVEFKELAKLNEGIAPMLGMVRGLTHAEFVRSHQNGRMFFLEVAGHIGNALVPEVARAASGIDLVREWARMEVAELRGEPYTPPKAEANYAGLVQCYSAAGSPDASEFAAAEIVTRLKSDHQAGVIVASASHARVVQLIDELGQKFIDQLVHQSSPTPPALGATGAS